MISVKYIHTEELKDFTKLPSKEIAFLDILDGKSCVMLTLENGQKLLISTSESADIYLLEG